MGSAFFTYRLKPGVTHERYEKWIVEFDYPHVEKMTDVILSQRIYRLEGIIFGSGPSPYDYVELIEFTNLKDYLRTLRENTNAQAIAAEMPKYVEVVSNSYGEFIPPGVPIEQVAELTLSA